uniref:Uncharacterized protein n=1 Tax=Cyprinodon variegatus TaxID=28743 RepID=A0A3Q2G2P9_CYPVA
YSSSPDSCVRTRKRPRNRGNKPRHGLSTDASVAKFLLDRNIQAELHCSGLDQACPKKGHYAAGFKGFLDFKEL